MPENAYAESLWKTVEGGRAPKEAVASLHDILEKKGRIALFPRIARAFKRIALREYARRGVVVSVAGGHATRAKKEAKQLLESLHIDADVLVQEDDTLIGGWRLEGREHLYDVSFKKHLLSIYNRTIQS